MVDVFLLLLLNFINKTFIYEEVEIVLYALFWVAKERVDTPLPPPHPPTEMWMDL